MSNPFHTGSNLPPGVSTNDIERAFGDQPSLLEDYIAHYPASPEMEELLELGFVCDFIEAAMVWAYALGEADTNCDDSHFGDD